jgi:hypothetical protein
MPARLVQRAFSCRQPAAQAFQLEKVAAFPQHGKNATLAHK